jgi:hypothetical protein
LTRLWPDGLELGGSSAGCEAGFNGDDLSSPQACRGGT